PAAVDGIGCGGSSVGSWCITLTLQWWSRMGASGAWRAGSLEALTASGSGGLLNCKTDLDEEHHTGGEVLGCLADFRVGGLMREWMCSDRGQLVVTADVVAIGRFANRILSSEAHNKITLASGQDSATV